jgi:hypothetical protein
MYVPMYVLMLIKGCGIFSHTHLVTLSTALRIKRKPNHPKIAISLIPSLINQSFLHQLINLN